VTTLLRLWLRVDHARYVARYGHAGPSAGQDWARLHAMNTRLADGHVIGGERQTVRSPDRPQLLWRRWTGER
jgi:hypothetical protein